MAQKSLIDETSIFLYNYILDKCYPNINILNKESKCINILQKNILKYISDPSNLKNKAKIVFIIWMLVGDYDKDKDKDKTNFKEYLQKLTIPDHLLWILKDQINMIEQRKSINKDKVKVLKHERLSIHNIYQFIVVKKIPDQTPFGYKLVKSDNYDNIYKDKIYDNPREVKSTKLDPKNDSNPVAPTISNTSSAPTSISIQLTKQKRKRKQRSKPTQSSTGFSRPQAPSTTTSKPIPLTQPTRPTAQSKPAPQPQSTTTPTAKPALQPQRQPQSTTTPSKPAPQTLLTRLQPQRQPQSTTTPSKPTQSKIIQLPTETTPTPASTPAEKKSWASYYPDDDDNDDEVWEKKPHPPTKTTTKQAPRAPAPPTQYEEWDDYDEEYYPPTLK